MLTSVRDTLVRLEHQIQEKIAEARAQLVPLERELAAVRRALAALMPPEEPVVITPKAASLWLEGNPPIVTISSSESAYQKLTMKQLAVKALQEHFPNGASAIDMIDFFHKAWGRTDVSRSSLSPQLSRLKKDGMITLRGTRWLLVTEAQKSEAPTEDQSEGASGTGEGDAPPNESRKVNDLLG